MANLFFNVTGRSFGSPFIIYNRLTNLKPISLIMSDSINTENVVFESNNTYGFTIEVVARNELGNLAAHFTRKALVICDDFGNLSPVGEINIIGVDNNLPGWALDIGLNQHERSLDIEVFGPVKIYWVARIDLVQLSTQSF